MTHIMQVYSKQYVDNLLAENKRMKKAANDKSGKSEFIAIKAEQVAELMAENKDLRAQLKKMQTQLSCPHFRTYETESGLACRDCDWTQ